jgi:hypothetical protein
VATPSWVDMDARRISRSSVGRLPPRVQQNAHLGTTDFPGRAAAAEPYRSRTAGQQLRWVAAGAVAAFAPLRPQGSPRRHRGSA